MAGEIELLPIAPLTHLVGHGAGGVAGRYPRIALASDPRLIKWRLVRKLTTRNAILGIDGDSTIRGQSTGGGASQGVNSFPMKLARYFQSRGINAGANNVFGVGGFYGAAATMANLVAADGRLAFTGATAQGADEVLGGNNFNFPSAASSLSFTPQDQVTKFVIRWRDGAAGRNFNWLVDGGATTAINSSGTTQYVATTVSAGAKGAHTLTLNWVAGNVTILGIDAYDDTSSRREISVHNYGISGATSAQLASVSATPVGRLNQPSFFGCDLLIMECGIINDWRQSVAVATSKANMTTLVSTRKAAGVPIVLMTPVFDSSATGATASQEDYVTAMYQVAAEQDVPIIDIRPALGSFALTNAAGGYSDTVHPNATLYDDIAEIVGSALLTA
ncbi:GDSL-type esterase/lipase family protein [Bosea sp. ASV33]|uniref:SGNH/GDSL hydrolase family protein n=1 Tax=Bosea sp. ASV33 TaxID=2795106 RepID=UPI0018EC7B23|nr:GDSL-type esterase/lipase family protein [Bosea sp. ASV33]